MGTCQHHGLCFRDRISKARSRTGCCIATLAGNLPRLVLDDLTRGSTYRRNIGSEYVNLLLQARSIGGLHFQKIQSWPIMREAQSHLPVSPTLGWKYPCVSRNALLQAPVGPLCSIFYLSELRDERTNTPCLQSVGKCSGSSLPPDGGMPGKGPVDRALSHATHALSVPTGAVAQGLSTLDWHMSQMTVHAKSRRIHHFFRGQASR
jgi:hypothetical protein